MIVRFDSAQHARQFMTNANGHPFDMNRATGSARYGSRIGPSRSDRTGRDLLCASHRGRLGSVPRWDASTRWTSSTAHAGMGVPAATTCPSLRLRVRPARYQSAPCAWTRWTCRSAACQCRCAPIRSSACKPGSRAGASPTGRAFCADSVPLSTAPCNVSSVRPSPCHPVVQLTGSA